MKIQTIIVGELETNCYLVIDEDSKNCFVVDPGSEPEKIDKEIRAEGLHIKGIINTHSHYDHIGGNSYLKKKYSCPIYIHSSDAGSLVSPEGNLSSLLIPGGMESFPADKTLKDGDVISDGNIKLTVMHTPGHTPGGICLIGDKFAITGDTLFWGSVGRIDLPGGDDDSLMKSLGKLKKLPPEMIIYPGHGTRSTIGEEVKHNPYLQ